MKRSAIKRRVGLRSHSRINPVSRRRRQHNQDPARATEFQAVKDRSHGQCERIVKFDLVPDDFGKKQPVPVDEPFRCVNAATQKHHVLPKGRGGKDHRDNLLDLCAYCHQFTLDWPIQATEEGTLR